MNCYHQSNPNDLWIKAHEQRIGTMITAATFQTLGGKKVTTPGHKELGMIGYVIVN